MNGPKHPPHPAEQDIDLQSSGVLETLDLEDLAIDENDATGNDPYNSAVVPDPDRHWRG